MKKTSNGIRNWWKKPRINNSFEAHRQVSFLELFYDLVYVALIAQLSHALADEITIIGVTKFVFLFSMVWWYWLNGTLYHDLHGNNDIRTRVFTFLQMIPVVGMAMFAEEAFHSGAIGFTISAISLLIILLFLWSRVGYHHKQFKPLSRLYTFFLFINIGLLGTSMFVEPLLNHWLWLSTVAISFFLPVFISIFSRFSHKINIDHTTQASTSLVERFGLFNIIVLGEIIIAVVSGSSYVKFNTRVAALCFFGVLLAIGIWWLYYDFISHRKPKKGSVYFVLWYYLHLPLTVGITGVGASILYIIKNTNEPFGLNVNYLFLAGMATILFCIAVLFLILDKHSETSKYLSGSTTGLVVIAGIYIGLLFIEMDIVLLLALSVLLLFVPTLNSVLKNHLNTQKAN